MDQILSLCTGIGGLDLGLHAGLRLVGRVPRAVGYVEREAFAVACLGKAIEEGRLDNAPVWCGDLQVMPVDLLPRVDWICGGYPCQPFSPAGKRQGENDPRHLWPGIRDLVRGLRPAGVLFENVSGHVSMGLFDVLSDLEKIGYRTAWGLYRAEQVGAPHRRERVFILGLADGDSGGLEKLGERDSQPKAWSEVQQRKDAHGCDQGWCDRSECCIEGCDCDMADSSCPRFAYWISEAGRTQGNEEPEEPPHHRRRLLLDFPGFPSPPGGQYLDEPPRTVKSRLGRNADGLPCRVDRLRALGNAVVPQQAELAFLDLWEQLQ